MITLMYGNIAESRADIIVTPVNCVGIMGTGVALSMRKAYPSMFTHYSGLCKKKELTPGKVLIWINPEIERRYVALMATKDHWKQASDLNWIKEGMNQLVAMVQRWKVKTVAIPALGCGAGELQWRDVFPIIEAACKQDPERNYFIYQPIRESLPAYMPETSKVKAEAAALLDKYTLKE